jgi:hypothetical protein
MAGEADNSEYWDALAAGLAKAMSRPEVLAAALTAGPAPVAFGGYVAVPCGSGDSNVYAWWADGSIAMMDLRTPLGYIPLKRPDYATLFPASPSAPFVTAASNPTVGEGPRPEADQPRPDDADDTEYPRTRRGRDD